MSLLDPVTWDAGLVAAARLADPVWERHPKPRAEGRRHVVVSHWPLSTYAGLQALRSGGSAADAVVAMVALDCVLTPGFSSLGGTLGALYHHADSEQTSVLNAGLQTPRRVDEVTHDEHERRGGDVMVPGVVAGLEAISNRFGRLPWRDLLLPAISFAQRGFPVWDTYCRTLRSRESVILRTREGRAVFASAGRLPSPGELFAQPLLAETLGRIAEAGSSHMYRGDLAGEIVSLVQADGGILGMADLASYRAEWEEPLVGSYLDYEIRTSIPPHYAGIQLLFALNVVEALGHHECPQREQSSETLYEEIAVGLAAFSGPFREMWNSVGVGARERDGRIADVLSKGYAREVADAIRRRRLNGSGEPSSVGTHLVAAIDSRGDMAVVLHSVEGPPWGRAGIFAGGIALNGIPVDRASRFGAGRRLWEPVNCYVALRDGRPVLAGAACNVGVLAATLQNTVNVLGFGMDPHASVDRPRWGVPTPERRVQVEPFASDILDGVEDMGQPVQRAESYQPSQADTGLWTAVGLRGQTRIAVTDPRVRGLGVGE